MIDIASAERRLQPYVDVAGELWGKDITIGRTVQLAKHVGNPQQRLRVVHVAGTSGKTSTSYYITGLLATAGCKTGLTVSPHIDSLTERVQIDGQPISDDKFCTYMEEFLALVESAPTVPTYYELMMVFALWVFDREAVDYAVIETGLGGLHDSSNICQRADKVAIITDIGLDHTQILGNTLAEIATQKLGIVHRGNAIVTHQQPPEVMSLVEATAQAQLSELMLAVEQTVNDDLPAFQRRNWSLAKSAYDYIAERDALVSLNEQQLVATQNVHVLGRMDVQHVGDKVVVIDGAHNQQKLAALVESFTEKFAGQQPLVVVAVKQGKDIEQMAPLLAQLTDHVIVTGIEVIQDTPHQSIATGIVADALTSHDIGQIDQVAGNQAALERALQLDKGIVLIVGSLYLASSMRRLIDKLQ